MKKNRLLIATGESIPLRGSEGVPGLPGAPRKENQISQVRNLSLFYVERCKSLSSLKSFLRCAPQLSEASVLCFHIQSFLRAHSREWLQSVGC